MYARPSLGTRNFRIRYPKLRSRTKISKQEPEPEPENKRDQKVDPVIQSVEAGNWFHFRNNCYAHLSRAILRRKQEAPSAYHASGRPCQQESLPDFLIFYWSKRSPGEDNPLMLSKSPVLCYQTRLFNNILSCCGRPARFCLLPDLNVYSSETAQCV